MNLDQDERRGEAARQILESEIFKEAYSTIEQRLLNELATIEIKAERAEYLRQLIVMGRKYKAYMQQVLLTGKMAVEQKSLLERMKEAAKRATQFSRY
jgi:hypothetical protein